MRLFVHPIIPFFGGLFVFNPAKTSAAHHTFLAIFAYRMRWFMQVGVVVLFGGRLRV
jgi:hypothetical protein